MDWSCIYYLWLLFNDKELLMWEKILVTVYKKPLFSIGVFLMIFPLPYSFGSGIFDHLPFHSGVLASIFMLGMIIAYFGDRYESKKNKKDE